MTICLPIDDPDNNWTYCPSLPAAAVFAGLFGLTTIAHIYQAHHYRKTFCWVLIMGAIWETAAYIIRPIAILSPTKQAWFDPQFMLILLAPLWINAFDYMVLGRMVYYFLDNKRLMGIKAERMAIYFVLLDILSFLVQITGGLMTLSKNFNTLNNGLHIYTTGVALQQFFILSFVFLIYKFQQRLRRECSLERVQEARKLLVVLYISLALISFRIVFRIVEFSAGAGTALTSQLRAHEWYQYVFDAIPMFLALVAMNVFHPGRMLVSADSEFKSRKERKMERREKERVRGGSENEIMA